ncbi:hypothetical protein BSKO_05403 [Bryopsis sp. KO-2023]|nr:hypothetical protein BSKO_05403 [Bryopsis sp. KO-2023]
MTTNLFRSGVGWDVRIWRLRVCLIGGFPQVLLSWAPPPCPFRGGDHERFASERKILDIDSPDFEANVQSLVGRLLGGDLFLLDLVLRGVRSELIENEEQVFSGFFASRLADWASLQSALLGCLTLLQGVRAFASLWCLPLPIHSLKRCKCKTSSDRTDSLRWRFSTRSSSQSRTCNE